MKRFVFILILISGLISVAGFSQEQRISKNNLNGGDDWWYGAVGLYQGIISSGQQDLPGLTNFYIGIDGTLRGEYEISDRGRTVSGRLFESVVTDALEIKFKWKDSYGVGDLTIKFNDDLSEFEGYWSVPGDSRKYLWTGKR